MSSKQTFLRAMKLAKQGQGLPLPPGGAPAEPKIRPRFANPRRETLVFVSLAAENAGFQGNVCKVGPAFKGLKRLATEQRLSVIFKLPGIDSWMQAAAKVVWVSSSGQDCGLELVNIAEESRRLVENWLALRGQASRPGANPGSQPAQAVAASTSPGFETDSYQIVLPVEAIEIVPQPQPQGQASPPVAAQASAGITARRVAASMPKGAPGFRPAAPLSVPAAVASDRAQMEVLQQKGLKIDRKTARMFGLALTGFAAIPFLAGVVLGRLRSVPPPRPAIVQRVVSSAPLAVSQPPVMATQNSVEALPAKTGIAPAPVRTSPFEMPTQRANSLKKPEAPQLRRAPNVAAGAASHPDATRPTRAQQFIHPAAPSAPVPAVAETRPAAPPVAVQIEPRPIPPSNSISAHTTAPATPPAAAAAPPLPTAAAAVISETLTGSIEVIPDLYPSIRVAAQSKTKPSGPAALTIGRLISRIEPVYPSDALSQRISGTVKLHVVQGLDGRIETATVTEGPTQLGNAALQAIKQWRYEPTLLGTAPVETEEDITVIFRIATSSRSGS
jgi:protein TonB